MPQFHIVCALPNASNKINGIAFDEHEDHPGAKRTLEPVTQPIAEHFASIPGYSAYEVEEKKEPAAKKESGAKKETAAKPAAALKPADASPPEQTNANPGETGQASLV